MELLQDFIAWAWARHHNILSWYIRPLFIIPFCYFAYKRSLAGVLLTVVALMSSIFWFPVPAQVSPGALSALAAEKEYLLGEWPAWKIAASLSVPLLFAALGTALWRRSYGWGLVVVNVMLISKVVWTGIFFDQKGFLEHLAPAVVGVVVLNAGFWAWRRHARQRPPQAD